MFDLQRDAYDINTLLRFPAFTHIEPPLGLIESQGPADRASYGLYGTPKANIKAIMEQEQKGVLSEETERAQKILNGALEEKIALQESYEDLGLPAWERGDVAGGGECRSSGSIRILYNHV